MFKKIHYVLILFCSWEVKASHPYQALLVNTSGTTFQERNRDLEVRENTAFAADLEHEKKLEETFKALEKKVQSVKQMRYLGFKNEKFQRAVRNEGRAMDEHILASYGSLVLEDAMDTKRIIFDNMHGNDSSFSYDKFKKICAEFLN